MRHALATPGAVGSLTLGVISPALGARLVPPAGQAELLATRQATASLRAVPVPAIAGTADLELRAAARTQALPKLLHPTPRAEEVSTGGLAEIIISAETKRLHPRGGPAATGSPVSSTRSADPRPEPAARPVSGGQIPRYPALAMIAGPRFAVIASSERTPSPACTR